MSFRTSIRYALTVWLALLTVGLTNQASAKVKVVTTVPELAYAANAIGGELVEAKALLRGRENPHFVDAVPEFTRLAAEADVVCVVGLDLEIGYMPAVLSRSGNAKVQPGGIGYCEAGKSVNAVDKPSGPIDRSMGDVHPSGNPHFFLSPKNLAASGNEIVAALSRVDPSHAQSYRNGLAQFVKSMASLDQEIDGLLAPIKKLQKDNGGRGVIIEYHREFSYFLNDHNLLNFGSIEDKPGVPPSAGRLAEVAIAAKASGVKVVLAADYFPKKTLDRFAELSGVGLAVVPTMIQTGSKTSTYDELQRHIARTLVSAATKSGQGY